MPMTLHRRPSQGQQSRTASERLHIRRTQTLGMAPSGAGQWLGTAIAALGKSVKDDKITVE
jgi:hypothetical protein